MVLYYFSVVILTYILVLKDTSLGKQQWQKCMKLAVVLYHPLGWVVIPLEDYHRNHFN